MGKLDGNGRWESSRIIVPELREAINNHRMKSLERPRLSFDEQQIELFMNRLADSYTQKLKIKVQIYGLYEPLLRTGIVTGFDQINRKFRLADDSDYHWIAFSEIEHIEEAN